MSLSPEDHEGSIVSGYRAVICDLDGVVYRGAHAIPGAIQALTATMATGRAVTFATNNASREPGVVEEHLVSLGLGRGLWEVVTSAQAAAACVVERLGTSRPVLAVGGPGVAHALRDADLEPVPTAWARRHGQLPAVVQGAGADVSWRDLAEAAHQVSAGALWVATNPDRSIPTPRGLAPGNGAMVAAVQTAVDATPLVAGKPEPWMYRLALRRLAIPKHEVLVVGDRLDTDIAAAHAAGLDSLFVLSGVHDLRDLVFCTSESRPTHVGLDIGALASPSRALTAVVTDAWRALDEGIELSNDTDTWRLLEGRLRG